MPPVQLFQLRERALKLREEGACVFNVLRTAISFWLAKQLVWSDILHAGHTFVTRMRWNSDLRRVRSSQPGERRLCSRRVKSRDTLSKVRSGESAVFGKIVTAILGNMKRESWECDQVDVK